MSRWRDDSGAIAIVVAVFSLAMFGFAAIIVDLGVARAIRTEAQTAADAAAISGAGALYTGASTTADRDRAVTEVKKSAYDNYLRSFYSSRAAADSAWATSATGTVPGAACPVTVVPSGWAPGPSGSNCILFSPASSANPTKVRVVIPSERSPSFFGGIVGYGGLTISDTTADAEIPAGPPDFVPTDPSCAVCLLDGGDHDLGNGNLTVSGGDVWINGSLSLSGNGEVNAPAHTVHVEQDVPANRRGQITSPLDSPTTAAPNPPAPAMPSWAGLPSKPFPCGVAGGTGRYAGLNLSSGTCALEPGLYVFTEPVDLTGSASLVGAGVTIYFACGVNGSPTSCAADSVKPELVKTSGATVRITASTAPTNQSVPGLALLYDDGLTQTLVLDDFVAGDLVKGSLYGRNLTLDAQSYSCESTFRSLVAVRSLRMSGPGNCFSTTYAAAENIAGPDIEVATLDAPVLSR